MVGIGWGLPASDGWDNDGVAPRDFLVGLVETVTPGHYFVYPPVHLVLLAVATAPATLIALLRAHSLAGADVVAEMLKVPTMTTIAIAARLVSLAMSLGIVWAVAKITEEVRGRRAGSLAAAFVGLNAPLTYYAHTSNLDGPYLFWGALALLALVRAIARREPIRLRRLAVFAALAVGTKDQAYALFLLAVPAALVLWIALDPWARKAARVVLRETLVAVGMGAGVLVVVDGIVFNPTGFRARVAFVVGQASLDVARYSSDWIGRRLILRDIAASFPNHYPLVFAPLMLAGLVAHVVQARRARPRLVAGLVPLLAAVSFTIAFNCVARCTDARFLLPQYVLLGVYVGLACDALLVLPWPLIRSGAVVCLAAAFAFGLFRCAAVDANLLLDPRYDVERWLEAHVRRGDSMEVYGLNVYLPRLPKQADVVRVALDPVDRRNPLPGVTEVRDAYGDIGARRPQWVVVSEVWALRYLVPPGDATHGRVAAPPSIVNGEDVDATTYFRSLFAGRDDYRVAYVARYDSTVWPQFDIHGSVARPVWVFERADAMPSR